MLKKFIKNVFGKQNYTELDGFDIDVRKCTACDKFETKFGVCLCKEEDPGVVVSKEEGCNFKTCSAVV